MKRFVINFLLTAGIVFSSLFIYRMAIHGSAEYNIFDLFRGEKYTPATAPLIGQTSPRGNSNININNLEVLAKVNDAFAELTEAVVPSVVSIDTKTKVNIERVVPTDPFGFFGYRQIQELEKPGLGSGAIVSEDGYIITNHHVVADVDEIQVTIHSGEKFEAEWIGADPSVDVAVLKIKQPEGQSPVKFRPLSFGDSDQVRVGEMALAIGNPFGLNETVTRGIISAKQRQLSDGANEYFQVDAVINPGNSGGPLVNIHGEMIGVNVAIFTGQQDVKVWQGIGLAIPSNEAREIYEAIAHKRPLVRGFLGVGLDDIPVRYAQMMGLSSTDGAVVLEVSPGSPAEAAGLSKGDVVLSIDGRKLKNAQDFIARIRRKKDGEKATLEVNRSGQSISLTPVFTSKSATNTLHLKHSGRSVTEALGIKVANLTEQQRYAMGIGNVPAIIITEVDPNSQAGSRFQAGDLIHSINRNRVTDVETYYKLMGRLPPGKSSIIILSRNGRQFEALIRL